MTRLFRGMLLATVTAGLLAFAMVAQTAKPSGAKMAEASNAFIGVLTPEQKVKACFPYDSPERVNWNFVPLQDKDRKPTRKGIRFEELSETQKAKALDILKAGLSQKGYDQATTIMSLENLLAELEKNGTNVRNPNWYFVSIFGEPSNTGKWGWRIEGHHLSVNITLEKGEVVSATPILFGSNPAEVKDGNRKGLRTLPEVEDLAKELIKSFTPEQDKAAKQAKAFADVVAKPKAAVTDPVGVTWGKLSDTQQKTLWKLMEAYAGRMPADAAADELKRVKDAGVEKIYFGYSGDTTPGKGYTYRVQGPTFVVEFLNMQADSAKNPANHIHSTWRRLPADFGLEK